MKRTKEHRDRITRGESPQNFNDDKSPRPDGFPMAFIQAC